ncbi:AraC family transcriptional regulator [Pelosinus sp. UFO1]|uniref:AraC family transcriptional regulator n=1 Tax=Pelosinus sp. UFO1 TaxID=484770 RepID=UPI0004D18C38|nr:AraC family transcriptional regulator [Pelosinus sp. UFO1]AIF52951.1 transcriptional regulator, AraC family [Pelosinus sp. UFO1]
MSNKRFILERKFADLIGSLGISTTEALKKSDLPEDLFSHKSPSLTTIQCIRFMETLKELSIDECTPIKIGTIESLETFYPPVFAAYCSRNVLTCMKRISTYKKLIGPLVFLVNENKDNITLEMTFENEENELPEFLVAAEMVFLVQLMRNATKTHIVPKEVMTKHRIDNNNYEKFFGVRPKIGPRNILTISKEDALRPFISQNDAMWEYFEPELKRRLSELDIEDTYAARVRSALIELLPAGEGSIDDVSSKLGCSKRTLQRKLKEEDTTFQKQLNHTRELLARHYLKNSDMTSDDIAYLLGYQDLNSFVRAFHIWTGMTISEYKKK